MKTVYGLFSRLCTQCTWRLPLSLSSQTFVGLNLQLCLTTCDREILRGFWLLTWSVLQYLISDNKKRLPLGKEKSHVHVLGWLSTVKHLQPFSQCNPGPAGSTLKKATKHRPRTLMGTLVGSLSFIFSYSSSGLKNHCIFERKLIRDVFPCHLPLPLPSLKKTN